MPVSCAVATILRVDNLWKSYTAGVQGCSARVWALRGCSLAIEDGERVAIVGSRGAGKRTLLQCIAGDRIDAGRIDCRLPLRLHFGEPGLRLTHEDGAPALHLVLEAGDTHALAAPALIASRDAASVHGAVDRILLLRDGRLSPLTRIAVRRVAERIAGV